MTVKYISRSGRIATEEELRSIFLERHPNASDISFGIWLYLGIDCGAIKKVIEEERKENDTNS